MLFPNQHVYCLLEIICGVLKHTQHVSNVVNVGNVEFVGTGLFHMR